MSVLNKYSRRVKLINILGTVALLSGFAGLAQVIEKPDLKRGSTVADKIFAIEDSAMEEWRKGNPMKWIEISAEDVTYVDPGLTAPIVGRDAYIQYLTPLKGKIFYDASEYVDPKVAVYGDTAVLTYNYHSKQKDASSRLQRSSFWNTTEIYRLIAGEWKIVHTHWSYIQHSLPESLEMIIPILKKSAAPLRGNEDAQGETRDTGDQNSAAEIIRRETRALERWRQGDPAGYLEIYAPEVTYFDSSTPGRINGFKELKKELVRLTGKIHYDVMDFVEPSVCFYDDTAIFFFRYFSTYLNPDGTIQKRTPWNCTEVYAKIAGEWKIIHSHWSLIKGERKDGGF